MTRLSPHMTIRALSLLSAGILGTACGDITSATGALGNIDYSLHSDYDIESVDLRTVDLLTRYTQSFDLELTPQGEDEVSDPSQITHSISPASGADLRVYDGSGELSNVDVTVSTPGTYRLESHLDGDLFDYIDLVFSEPAALDVLSYLRAPNDDDFVEAPTAEPVVPEGTQAAFILVPENEDGERILGEFDPRITADPEWMVVSSFDVVDVYENAGVVGAVSPCSVYFIEPGTVTLTLEDAENEISTTRTFKVEAINPEAEK